MFLIKAVIVAGLGLIFGSFATALSYRLPRDISMVTRVHSQCPSCRHNLGLPDLIPLFSWLFLKGKCRHCGARIGVRYPLIELATLGLCMLFFSVYGLTPETVAVFALAPVLVSITDIDFGHQIIPDSLNMAIFLIGVAAFAVNALLAAHPASFFSAHIVPPLAGAALYGGFAWLLRWGAFAVLKREALGLGDVKFFAAAGFWLGLNVMAASLLMVISGGAGVVLAFLWKKRTGEAEVPFGPSLIVAFIVVLCLFPPHFISL